MHPSPLFDDALAALDRHDPGPRRWVFVPYDQLSDEVGLLAREAPERIGIVLVESAWKPARRPYHPQKHALVLANQRHFALEQARRGVAVRVVRHHGPYREALERVLPITGPLVMMEAAERELRADLAPLIARRDLRIHPHEGWLTTPDDFGAAGGPPFRMDAFYRAVRRRTGILMHGGKPLGGKFSFDTENREPWKGQPPAPSPPTFSPDPVTEEVGALVRRVMGPHPGRLDLTTLPVTKQDAEHLWTWACEACLPHFGPFEDAMSRHHRGLFHSRVSSLVNLHRLLPGRIIRDALALDLPLASREGFVRQVLGWREFVRHVHLATDGFRTMPGPDGTWQDIPVRELPGDGGFSGWSGQAWTASTSDGLDGGADPAFLGAQQPVPPAYWGKASGLACLDDVVEAVWAEGYSHHITRLMVLSNLATLLDVSARDLTDWFWVAYTDAFDWVVEPNVLGMGTFATGDLMTTKPYVSGSAYLARMGDHCEGCAFDPRKTCPITRLYWAFLARHAERLAGNPRMAVPLASLRKRSAPDREEDARVARIVKETLSHGQRLTPGDLSPTAQERLF
ncbi:MAG: cryptochrome/photolyase family protein [bacterium]|nr:cryptochrome/photolyase family protein [bacterium]